MRREVDLNTHINASVIQGNPADFPVVLRPVFHETADGFIPVSARRAVVRQDTGDAIAVVSDRYTLVPHARIIELVEQAIQPLDVGPVPRGIYIDRRGARMRAVFKFPALAAGVTRGDDICPCLQLRNTYDGTSRVTVHIGAFRFVCTNLAVGGGGVFAGGFMSIHAGEIPIERMAAQLADYLSRFDQIVGLYRQWEQQPVAIEMLEAMFTGQLRSRPERLWSAVIEAKPRTVFDAYNAMTHFATHRMRSARTAFDLLERVNGAFQTTFTDMPPIALPAAVEPEVACT